MNAVTARGSAPIGIASGSMITSSGGIPWSPAAETIFFAIASRSARLHPDLVVVREPDHRRAVPRDDRQDRLQPLVLAGHRVDERLALVRGEPRLERLDDRGVDAERQVGEPLHERDRLSHQARPRRPSGRRRSRRGRRRRRPPAPATSISTCERSPAWSWAWKALRPVGLIRSPMMQNGCSGPMTTVLDGATGRRSPLLSLSGRRRGCRAARRAVRCRPSRQEADQVQAGDARERGLLGESSATAARSIPSGIGGGLAASRSSRAL